VPNVVADVSRINAALDKIGGSYVVSVGGTGRKLIPGAADGMLIPGNGGPRADDRLIRVSSGEAVVPAHLVPEMAPWAAARGIPGFANGGYIGDTNVMVDTQDIGGLLVPAINNLFAQASAAGSYGPGVGQWAGLAASVLAQLGLSPNLLGKVLSQMNTESGGNSTIVNTTDSNAAAGHPSMGLMQVIAGTFAAYAGPYLSRGILDPLANIYAGLNYAAHRYGPNLNGLGEGHGYAVGGGATGWATVGERGAENVYFGSNARVFPADETRRMNARSMTLNSSVVVNIPPGVGGSDSAEIRAVVQQAVQEGLGEVVRHIDQGVGGKR
jgi:hypothetical protein